jgi:glycosyltransferase involved in cell wall biosynthesis
MLSIVIPAHSGVPRVRCAITCLMASLRPAQRPVEVIVVNDGASSEVRECVENLGSDSGLQLHVVDIPRKGRSGARNAGVAHARGDRILFLDADILAGKEVIAFHAELGPESEHLIFRGRILHLPWLCVFEDPLSGELTEEASRSLRVGGGKACLLTSRRLSCEALESPDMLKPMARTPQFQRDLERWFEQTSGGRMDSWIGCTGGQFSIARAAFERLGGFDEAMGMRWGAEDLEFGYRAAHEGVTVRQSTTAYCYHMDHTSSGRTGDHEWALGYFARKHGNDGVLRLLDYFDGKCSLAEAVEACHAPA